MAEKLKLALSDTGAEILINAIASQEDNAHDMDMADEEAPSGAALQKMAALSESLAKGKRAVDVGPQLADLLDDLLVGYGETGAECTEKPDARAELEKLTDAIKSYKDSLRKGAPPVDPGEAITIQTDKVHVRISRGFPRMLVLDSQDEQDDFRTMVHIGATLLPFGEDGNYSRKLHNQINSLASKNNGVLQALTFKRPADWQNFVHILDLYRGLYQDDPRNEFIIELLKEIQASDLPER